MLIGLLALLSSLVGLLSLSGTSAVILLSLPKYARFSLADLLLATRFHCVPAFVKYVEETPSLQLQFVGALPHPTQHLICQILSQKAAVIAKPHWSLRIVVSYPRVSTSQSVTQYTSMESQLQSGHSTSTPSSCSSTVEANSKHPRKSKPKVKTGCITCK